MADKKGLGQVISWWICTFVALIFVAVRLIVRWNRFGKLYADDYFITLSLCCLIGDLGIQQHMWNLGMSDLTTVTRSEMVGIFQMIVPGSSLYVSSIWAIKLSLVIFYKRLAARTTFQVVYNITMIGIIATWTGIVLFNIFECFPIPRKWTQNPADACSTTVSTVNYWITILLNILSDIFIMALPISMVLRMKLPMKQKLGIVAVFCLGFGVIVASIIRAYYSHRNETMLTSTVSIIETSVSIIATCLPIMRTLIFPSRSQASSSVLDPADGRHYQLSSSRHGGTRTKIAGGTNGHNRISVPGTSNWPFNSDRSGNRTAKTLNDSDESLFRPVGADKNATLSKIAEVDPRTLGVLPDSEGERISNGVMQNRGSKLDGIVVTTAYQVTETTLL